MGPRSCDRGKGRSNSGQDQIRPGFNGAAVMRPRKVLSPECPKDSLAFASMGPRSCDRGKDYPSRVNDAAKQAASMGPRSCDRGKKNFIEPRILPRTTLQWGRGHATAESSLPLCGDGCALSASMGPRSCDRGKRRRDARDGNACTGASMGPRSCDRGKLTVAPTPRSTLRLQWGRGHATAERPMPANNEPTLSALQWGRGHATAES